LGEGIRGEREGNSEYESKRAKKQPPYRSTLHVSPTSSIVERLFSRRGITMRPHRRLMDPSTLEVLVMLRFSRDLWNERDVDLVVARSSSTLSITTDTSDAGASTFITPISSNRSAHSNSSVSSSSFTSYLSYFYSSIRYKLYMIFTY
jgi:hypothetical protein